MPSFSQYISYENLEFQNEYFQYTFTMGGLTVGLGGLSPPNYKFLKANWLFVLNKTKIIASGLDSRTTCTCKETTDTRELQYKICIVFLMLIC